MKGNQNMLDWVIRNARTVDGLSGERQADVCVRGERIEALLPPGSGAEAAREVDATGLLLAPGFIDIHRHADLLPLSDQPWSEPAQGLTCMISGNCGFSPAPNSPETFQAAREYAAPILGLIPESLRGMSARAFYREIAARRLRINCGYLVGNGDLCRSVIGFSDAPMTAKQLQEIRAALDDALDAGALGLSMGLMYAPECYCDTDTLAAIARVPAGHGKPVIAHIRGEGRSVVESVDEMIAIGRASGARIHISHMKAAGTDMWGRTVETMLAHIRRARQEGLDVTFDAYPYTAGSTTLLSLLPPEALEGGTAGVMRRIADPKERARILDEFAKTRDGWDNYIQTLGWGRIIIAGSSRPEEIGQTVQALAARACCDPGEYALALLLRESGCVPIVLEQMAPDDVRRILCEDDCIVISDSLYSAAGMPHPRKYGAFQRFLCQYVKEEKRIALPKAIDKITRMPADFLGLRGRGRLEAGCYADLVLMDWERLRDVATYTDPIRDSQGVCKVFVNGKLAFADGKTTGEAAGVFLKRAVHGRCSEGYDHRAPREPRLTATSSPRAAIVR
jgi:N-acyl-D-aspartate/D-glutamate deacylase